MKRLMSVCLFFLAAGLFAEQVFIRDLIGTVEVKRPNSTVWEAARKGQELSGDAMISTGFKSTAVVILGNSILTVRPLTRLSFTELSRIQDSEKVELKLQTGRVRAEVKPPQNGRTEFTVRSSAATAAVRGTVFEFDTLNLRVSEGTVEFSGIAGVPVLVDSGRVSYTGENSGGRAAPPEELAAAELKPELPLGSGGAMPQEGPVPEAPGVAAETAEINITLSF